MRRLRGDQLAQFQHQYFSKCHSLNIPPRQTHLPSSTPELLLSAILGSIGSLCMTRAFWEASHCLFMVNCKVKEGVQWLWGRGSRAIDGGEKGGYGCWCTTSFESILPSLALPFLTAAPSQSRVPQKERQRLISADNTWGTESAPRILNPKIKISPLACPLALLIGSGYSLDTYLFIIIIPNLITNILQCKGNAGILNKELGLHFLIVKLQWQGWEK